MYILIKIQVQNWLTYLNMFLSGGGGGVIHWIFGGGVLPSFSNAVPISDPNMPISKPIFISGLLNSYPFSDLCFLKLYLVFKPITWS